jgi:glycosyltransferase involved in cell wall biosynthesis
MFSYYFPPHFSGAGLYAVTLAKALAHLGVSVFFVTVDNSGLPREASHDGFRLYRVPDGKGRFGEWILWYRLWRLFSRHRHTFDILHATGSTYRNSAVGLIGWLLGKASLTVVSLAHNDLALVGRGRSGKLQRFLLRYVDRYVALSGSIMDEIHTLPLDSSKAVEIPQGVNTARFAPAAAHERAALRATLDLPSGPLALYVGVFDRRKQVEWLVRRWLSSPGISTACSLVLVGPKSREAIDAGLRNRLQGEVLAAGLGDRVLFREFVLRIEDYYRAADLFILPSASEGMPNVLLEAMACGLPCIVTRISGATDLITHGKSGMLFDVRDEAGFQEALSHLLADPGRRLEIGGQARAQIVERFATTQIAARYIDLYRHMLGHLR